MLSSFERLPPLQLPDPTRPEDINNEPMLFACDSMFAKRQADIHEAMYLAEFIDRAEAHWPGYDLVIDSRCHMLMPGMYPGIPGWHFDECPRSSSFTCPHCGWVAKAGTASGDFCRQCQAGPFRIENQPDLDVSPQGQPEHMLCVVDLGTGSLTEFAVGDIDHKRWVPRSEDQTVWGWADYNVGQLVQRYVAHPARVGSRDVIVFGHGDYHRAVPATGQGWRLFMRATRRSKRGVFNKVRNQTQVYLTAPSYGW